MHIIAFIGCRALALHLELLLQAFAACFLLTLQKMLILRTMPAACCVHCVQVYFGSARVHHDNPMYQQTRDLAAQVSLLVH